MPLPRNEDAARRGDQHHTPRRAVTHVTGRNPTPAEAQRRYRAGHRASGRGNSDPVFVPIRNGIPWRPYRYNGSGADALTGEVVVL